MTTITHATGELRKRAAAFIVANHFMGSDGGSGYLFTAVDGDIILGACLIGPASSMAAERAIVAAPWRVWQIKPLICQEICSVALIDYARLPTSVLLSAATCHMQGAAAPCYNHNVGGNDDNAPDRL